MNDYTCPNCGAMRTGIFCAACGQNRKSYVRSSWRIVGDLINEAFDLDSRLVRTIRALLFKPGFLSVEFSHNRRASYVPPARLYLIVSIVFFTTLSFTSKIDTSVALDVALADLPAEQRDRVAETLANDPQATMVLPGVYLDLEDDGPQDPWELALREWGRDMQQNPAVAYQEFLAKLPIAMFVMLPFYTLWLKLLYWRRFLAEHLVFALHLHAFLFVIGTAVLLLPDSMPVKRSSVLEIIYGPGVFLNGALQVAGGVYYFLALQRMYKQSWPATSFKFVAANIGHTVFLMVGVAATAVAMFLLR